MNCFQILLSFHTYFQSCIQLQPTPPRPSTKAGVAILVKLLGLGYSVSVPFGVPYAAPDGPTACLKPQEINTPKDAVKLTEDLKVGGASHGALLPGFAQLGAPCALTSCATAIETTKKIVTKVNGSFSRILLLLNISQPAPLHQGGPTRLLQVRRGGGGVLEGRLLSGVMMQTMYHSRELSICRVMRRPCVSFVERSTG